MQEVKMLDEKTDRKPFVYNQEAVEGAFKKIAENKEQILDFIKLYPAFGKMVRSQAFREKNFLNGALTFLALDHNQTLGVVPTEKMTAAEAEQEEEKMQKIRGYYEACKYVYEQAHDDSYYQVDAPLLLKAHAMLDIDNEKGNNVASYRFRCATDPEILMTKGTCFQPVVGDLVELRVLNLFAMFNNAWFKDPTIVRGAKFITEYFRIQPHMDGNKRTALMALNFMLIKDGYPEIFFDKKDQKKLINDLETAIISRDVTDLSLLIANKVKARQEEINSEIVNFRIENYMKSMK